jgi:Kef-type K+ transport system membrane component KefB
MTSQAPHCRWQLLILLAFSVLVVALFRRFTLPPIVGYLAVGMLLGPHARIYERHRRSLRNSASFLVLRSGSNLLAANDCDATRGLYQRRSGRAHCRQ